MHYIFLATVRILLAALVVLGVGFFALLGLMSIMRELWADDHQQPQPSESHRRLRDSAALPIGARSARR